MVIMNLQVEQIVTVIGINMWSLGMAQVKEKYILMAFSKAQKLKIMFLEYKILV